MLPSYFKISLAHWVLLLFVTLVVASCDETIYYGQESDEDPPAVYTLESGFSFEISISTQNRLLLEAITGDIEIVGDSTANQLLIEGRKVVTAGTQQAAQAALASAKVKITRLSDRLVVLSEHPASTSETQFEIDYAIRVPRQWNIAVLLNEGNVRISNLTSIMSVENSSGDITLENIRGEILLENTTGDVILNNISGSVVTELESGNINATVTMPEYGQAHLSTLAGNIALQIPAQTNATLSADATTGTVQLFNLTLQQAVFGQHSVSGVLNSGNGVINLLTANGNIVINGF
jgi:DUF4097 and DUF4098 domain-containing protein YvlB